MAGTLNLTIITPDRVVLEKNVNEVIARAIDGEFAVLPNHEPMVTALAIDVLRFRTGNVEETAAVLGGLLEVADNNTVTVLSDTVELDTEIDEAKAKEDKDRAEAEKLQKTDKLDIYISEMAMSKAMARLRAAELGRRRKHHTRVEQ